MNHQLHGACASLSTQEKSFHFQQIGGEGCTEGQYWCCCTGLVGTMFGHMFGYTVCKQVETKHKQTDKLLEGWRHAPPPAAVAVGLGPFRLLKKNDFFCRPKPPAPAGGGPWRPSRSDVPSVCEKIAVASLSFEVRIISTSPREGALRFVSRKPATVYLRW